MSPAGSLAVAGALAVVLGGLAAGGGPVADGAPSGAAPPGAAAAGDERSAGVSVVSGGVERDALWARKPGTLRSMEGALVVEGARTVLWAPVEPGRGDFTATFELLLPELAAAGSGVRMDSSVFGIDGPGGELYTSGPLFSGGATAIPDSAGKVRAGVPFEVRVSREGEWLECLVNGERVMRTQVGATPVGRIGIWAGRGAIAVGSFAVSGVVQRAVVADAVWSAGGEVWDEVSLPAIAALADGTLLVSGSAVRSDEQGKDVRGTVVRARNAAGQWGDSRVAGPEGLGGSDSTLIADAGAVHLIVQSGGALKRMQSADGGASWSAPADVPLPSPRSRLAGHGIRVAVEGGAVLCVPVTVPVDGGGRSVTLLRSRDGGATWAAGAPLVEASDAPAVVDLGKGRLAVVGVRPQMDGRWIWTSDDAGATWGAPLACGGLDPGTMRACVWRGPDGALMLSESARRVPNSLRRWRSDDGGVTWIEQLPVQMAPAGACAVAVVPDGAAWIAYEGGDFARREHVLVRKAP